MSVYKNGTGPLTLLYKVGNAGPMPLISIPLNITDTLHLIPLTKSRNNSNLFFMKTMTNARYEWKQARDELVYEITKLGYPSEFGSVIAKNLGNPKAIRRMSSYLRQVKPKKPEMIADEMLAIMSEVEAWKRKKEAEASNAAYNELLLRGLDDE